MSDLRPEVGPAEPERPGPDEPDAGAASDAAASERLTPGGARLRQRPEVESRTEPEVDEPAEGDDEPDEETAPAPPTLAPAPSLKRYYLGAVLMLIGIGLGLYGFVDIYGARASETGGLSVAAAAKITLGGALLVFGQNIVRAATNDPRARR